MPVIEDICIDECAAGKVVVWFTLANQGYNDITDPITVEFIGQTDAGAVILSTYTWTVGLLQGTRTEWIDLELTGVPSPLYDLTMAVDGGNTTSLSEISECYENNNEDTWGAVICL